MTKEERQPDLTIVFKGGMVSPDVILRTLEDAALGRFRLRRLDRPDDTAAAEMLVVRFQVDTERCDVPVHPIVETDARAFERRWTHCQLMDAHRVPNGCKAIAIALASLWTDRHRETFGEPAPASSVKRWRAEARRRDSWGGRHQPSRASTGDLGEGVARRVRMHHAIRVRAAGITMREGYEGALQEMADLEAGSITTRRRPEGGSPPFSYTTFRRDCQRLTRHGRRRG